MTQTYITPNISIEDFPSELSKVQVGPINTSDWIYKGSLLTHIEQVPLNIKSLIPLKYFLKFGKNINTPQGKSILSYEFTNESASEVMDIVSRNIAKHEFKRAFNDISRYISIVAIELVRNGIIENLKQKSSKIVHLEISESEDDIIVQVVDHHGLFKSERFIKRLKEINENGEYERKEHGAGLGLFMVMNSASMISFEVEESKSTKVFCIINKYKRLKHFKEKETAIFFKK